MEIIFNLNNIPLLDKLDLHQCIGDMLQTEVVKHVVPLKNLERRLKMIKENQKREKICARATTAQLENLKRSIRGTGADNNTALRNLLTKVEVENQELKQKLNMSCEEHV